MADCNIHFVPGWILRKLHFVNSEGGFCAGVDLPETAFCDGGFCEWGGFCETGVDFVTVDFVNGVDFVKREWIL